MAGRGGKIARVAPGRNGGVQVIPAPLDLVSSSHAGFGLPGQALSRPSGFVLKVESRRKRY